MSTPPDANDLVWRAGIEADIREIKQDVKDLDRKFEEYTHKYQFEPVRNVAYGLVGAVALMLVGALGTLLAVGGPP